jgi:hypothetical protein
MSLFSTPQRKMSNSSSSLSGNDSSTPLLHHSPGLSPIVSYKPMKSTSGMKTTRLLPGIAEEDTHNDTFSTSYNHLSMHSSSISFDTPLRRHHQTHHHHHSDTPKRSHMDESYLKSMSLLKDDEGEEDFLIDEFKNSPKKEKSNNDEEEQSEDSHTSKNKQNRQNPTLQPNYYHQSLIREENRKLIEDVNSRYGKMKAVQESTNGKSDFPSSSSRSPKTTQTNMMKLSGDSASPLYTASASTVPPLPPSSSSSSGGNRSSPSVAIPISSSPQVPSQPQGGPLPSLPIGSFYALLLDQNQQPVLIPVMSSLSPMPSHVASPAFKPTYEQIPMPTVESKFLCFVSFYSLFVLLSFL